MPNADIRNAETPDVGIPDVGIPAVGTDYDTVVKRFVIEEFLPDVSIAELDSDYDLMAGGVIDSLGLLKTMAWLEDRFDLRADRIDLSPDSFRSVAEISRFVEQTQRQQVEAK